MRIRYKYILFILYQLIIIYSVYICTIYIIKENRNVNNIYSKSTNININNRNTKEISKLHKNTFYSKNATIYTYASGHHSHSEYICPNYGKDMKILIIITSALTHGESRMAIRHTWGQYKISKPILIGFFLGSTTNDTLQEEIDEENEMFRDIIQGSFIDSYMNLTLKTISVLEWVYNYCSKVDFILKADDDAFVNIPRLLEMTSHLDKEAKHIYGQVSTKWKTHQESTSKYYVPVYEYNNTILPDFTVGVAYMFPSKIVYELYVTALNTTFMRLEDVFLTGITRQKTDIKVVSVEKFVNKKKNYTACDVEISISCHLKQAFSNHLKLWTAYRENTNFTCV